MSTVSLREAAAELGVSYEWYAEQLRTRKLPGHKIARKWRLTPGDIQAALDAHASAAIATPENTWGVTARSRRLRNTK